MNYLPPYLFPPVAWYLAGIRAGEFRVNMGGNFVKQTERNRFTIMAADGPRILSVPVKRSQSKQLLRDAEIDFEGRWQLEHARSLASAYGKSPFYEFYDYKILPLLEEAGPGLSALLQGSMERMQQLLKIDLPLIFERDDSSFEFIELPEPIDAWPQVFEDRLGFHGDVSVLDLLFNTGPMANEYLQHYPLKPMSVKEALRLLPGKGNKSL